MNEFGSEAEEGAPDWVVTFGDLMSLLLCFFVLMLSFSEMDRNKYRVVSGSLKNAFGIQRQKPIFDSPRGVKMISREFDQSIVLPKIESEIARPIDIEVHDNFTELEDLIEVEVEDTHVTIRMMGEATFDLGRTEIRPRFQPLLKKIGRILNQSDGEIIVAGHTDDLPVRRGPFKSNLGLSAVRAATVADFLIQAGRIQPERISAMGFGENRPIASNATSAGRQKNRRVEIILSR